jgi:hypothetical protein
VISGYRIRDLVRVTVTSGFTAHGAEKKSRISKSRYWKPFLECHKNSMLIPHVQECFQIQYPELSVYFVSSLKIVSSGKNIHSIQNRVLTMTKIGTVYTLGIWTVKPGKEAAFIKSWDDFAVWTSMNQQGVQNAVLVQDAENPQKFLSFWPWQDKEAAI